MKRFLTICFAIIIFHQFLFSVELLLKEKDLFEDEKLFKQKIEEKLKFISDGNEGVFEDENILLEYILLKDTYLKFFEKKSEVKKKEYKKLLDEIEGRREKTKNPLLSYCLAILYGRYGELLSIMDAVKMDIPNKIKDCAENVIKRREEIDDYGAYLILGRLYGVTPKIPFYTGWQSFEVSEYYLKKYIEKNKNSVTGKFFLAETYRAMKKTNLYDSIIEDILKNGDFETFQDKKILDSLKKSKE